MRSNPRPLKPHFVRAIFSENEWGVRPGKDERLNSKAFRWLSQRTHKARLARTATRVPAPGTGGQQGARQPAQGCI